ncbi:hypothetical protein H7U19_10170 [Hyunsoonleella sp. SJ7]|uniref:DUF4179 domain-containing protein n=1 Tax=Hyunsoonleella aquatilis TaxID=2762758 RepID=A0A923KIL4_9FLAO|nr:hypothetical protein [Hyunsoonleella aquatilis]MBC3758769.1 hypothetical protein [Hyunsoonleella aquatilis]
MNKDNLDELFENLKEEFDVETPSVDHEQRFLNKLQTNSGPRLVEAPKQRRRLWKPLIGVAASIVLLIALTLGAPKTNEIRDLASVSPEMAEAQNFFSATISEELNKLNAESDPNAQVLIQDAIKRLNMLEKEYQNLKMDLTESEEDKRVIYAMISNFQTRIDILQRTLLEIEHVKQLKSSSNETSSTI